MTKRALCIGTNYPGTSFSLAGCVNDALDWSHALAARGFAVDMLIDQQASRAAILDSLTSLLHASDYGDLLVVTFSGHGTYVPGGEDEPRDEAICPNDLRSAGVITDDQLYDLFSQRRHGVRAVMVADSCYSGTLNRLASALAPQPARTVRFLPPGAWMGDDNLHEHPKWTRAAATTGRATLRTGALVLAGCGEGQVCYDAYFDKANGAFTYAALKALAELPVAGATYRRWMRQIHRYLPSTDFDQRPQLDGSSYQKGWTVLDDGEEG